jgi:hypothetical protein
LVAVLGPPPGAEIEEDRAMNLLQALPPILGFAGFVIYQLLRPRSGSHQVISRVLDKVRSEPGIAENPNYKGLAKKDLLEAVRSDQKLRALVGRKDTEILMRAMGHQFKNDVMVFFSLLIFAVAGMVLFSVRQWNEPREWREKDVGVTKHPDPDRRMRPAQFERGVEKHYKADHGKIARDYMAQPENVNRLLEAFLSAADKKALEHCRDVTEQLIMGFCPAELTATIEGFEPFPSPEQGADLNSWVKQIEDIPYRAKIHFDGEALEATKTVEWWVLYCGTLEYLRSDAVSDCLDDARKMGPVARHAIRAAIRGSPRLSISELVARLQRVGVDSQVLDRLGRIVSDLPADIDATHGRYADKYAAFLRELYGCWYSGRAPQLADAGGREVLRSKVREFLEDLLEESRLEVKRIESKD